MGRHEPAWSQEILSQLVSLPEKYGYTWFEDNGTLTDHVKVIPIDYDGVFARYVQEWGRSAGELRTKAAEHGISIPNVLSWLEQADESEESFFWTHVVDVLLYRFFPVVTAEVRLRVRLKLVEELEALKRDGQLEQSSVLAHSLGTSVMHDALALLGSQPVPTDQGPNESWMAGNHTFASFFTCANVTRVLETEPKVYQSVVRPPSAGNGTSYVDAYYNFRHRLDPFPMVRTFAPVGWGNRYVEMDECEKVLHFNVHGFGHYLDDPRVHVPLLRSVLGNWVVTAAQRTKAIRQYDVQAEPACIGELLRFKAAAEKIIALARVGADPEALIIAGTQFLAAAREAYGACQ